MPKDVIRSLLYGFGTLALVVVDLFMTRILAGDDGALGDWGLLRSILFMGSGLALIGVDQAIIRRPIRARRYLPGLLLQACVLPLPLLLLHRMVDTLHDARAVYMACCSLAVIIGVGGYFRSVFRISMALLAIHCWRVLFGFCVLAGWLWLGHARHLACWLAGVLGCWAVFSLSLAWWASEEGVEVSAEAPAAKASSINNIYTLVCGLMT